MLGNFCAIKLRDKNGKNGYFCPWPAFEVVSQVGISANLKYASPRGAGGDGSAYFKKSVIFDMAYYCIGGRVGGGIRGLGPVFLAI